VVWVVNRNTIQHDQVLVRRTSPNIKSTGKITGGLYSRQHLQGAKYIGLNKSRSGINLPEIKRDLATLH
ncbi:uncharacterized protein METZ01_LOCUS127493, partial [marine metagenome]